MFLATHGILRSGSSAIPFTNTYSFEYDGLSDYLDLGTSLNITNAISVSAWIKTTQSGSTHTIIGEDEFSGNNRNWLLYQTGSNKLAFIVWNTNGSLNIAISPTANMVNDGNWHNVIATYDGSSNNASMKIYVDGSIDTSGNPSSTGIRSATGVGLSIGSDSGVGSSFFNGKIDEPAVFDYVLTPTEVYNYYNSGVPISVSSLNPVGHWRAENGSWDGSKWTITDSGSGGNDAESISMTLASRSTDVP